MPTEQKLEQYLAALDRALGQIPVSDRSEIITGIKSHILEAKERDPNQDIGQILAATGKAEDVANRYLLERGIMLGNTTMGPVVISVVKWLVIGALGAFGIMALIFIILVWRFTPFVKMDAEKGRVAILGGLIDVDKGEGEFRVGENFIRHKDDLNKFDGSSPIDTSKFELIRVLFSNGKIDVSPSIDNQLRWRCKVQGGDDSNFIAEEKNVFMLNFERTEHTQCDIQLPSDVAAKIKGSNGMLDVERPQANLEVELINGRINILPDTDKQYRYETKILNGYANGFKSSTAEDAIKIKVSLTNGYIKVD